MKLIYLGGKYGSIIGNYAKVDDNLFEYLNQFNWHIKNYKGALYAAYTERIKGQKKKTKLMHRVIMKITDPKILVDHWNLDGLDNQELNLRIATKSQNGANCKKKNNSSSIYLGVTKKIGKKRTNFQAKCGKDYKTHHCGTFKNEVDAALAYNEMATKLHGEFARLNIIENE